MAIRSTTFSRVIKSNFLAMYSLVIDIEGSEFDVVTKDSQIVLNYQAIIAEVHGDTKSKNDCFENIVTMG